VALAVLTNGGSAGVLAQEIYRNLFEERVGGGPPPPPTPPATPLAVALDEVVGTYRSHHVDLHVTASGPRRVRVRYEPRNRVGEKMMVDEEREYTGLRDDALISVEPAGGRHAVLVLCGRDEHNRVRWLHFGRAAVRI
jgi:hypothetical protein